MFEKILELFKKIGLKIEQEQEAQLKTEFEKIETSKTEDKSKPLEKPTGELAEAMVTIQALTKEVTDLKDLVGEMKKDRDASVAAQKEKMEADTKKKIDDLKTKGIKEGRITEATWEAKWKAIAEKNPDQFDAILSDLAVDPKLKTDNKSGDSGGSSNPPAYKGPLLGADSKMVEAMTKMDSN